MKICIYGGSFNPPHLGHTAALRAVRAAIEPDVTLVIPDRIPPHKELIPGSPEPSERLLMTMLAFSSEPGVEVSDMELHRSGKSYTVDTVRELRDCNPDAELYLVVGTDMLTTFEQWHDYRQLLAQVTDFLAFIDRQITVGRESTLSYHPAPKNSLFVLHVYSMHMSVTCQYQF